MTGYRIGFIAGNKDVIKQFIKFVDFYPGQDGNNLPYGGYEVLEVHIPNFNENLYNKKLQIEILSKIRDEKKFNNLEELKNQINKDVEECLK